MAKTHADDVTYQQVRQCFNELETVELTMAIITINSWNRLAVSFRKLPNE
ncbi:carboxymuconolactone decarboxylase family protein [Legionella tunisiensis]|nr:hypothetical protein [Legionella tunisiensis]